LRRYNSGLSLVNFLGNHDVPRIASLLANSAGGFWVLGFRV
jgi:hypothetical protein